ncbi:MAG TPA: type II secretion system protein GspG [Phycisphaerales bacterium]|nr:type II secretion system protein GspG [Phycisphaerales bacterium]HMP36381.1 type II secretion system protein GspG [Phycisphaerales bacterium]
MHRTRRPIRSRPGLARRRRAFTLLEVVVAITIVAILAAILVPNVLGFIGSSKVKAAQAAVESLSNQVNLYLADNGLSTIPKDFDLSWLREGNKPYLRSDNDLIDPWGNEYVIRVPGIVSYDFDVISFGADGEPGGEGENADIVSGERRGSSGRR